MTKKNFDIVVIGAGPGGYVAAIRAAHFGKKVALIEAGTLGGTCLNRGCIPTKTLIASADRVRQIQEASHFGIRVDNITIDYPSMMARKDKVVKEIVKNLKSLILSHGVEVIEGYAKFTGPYQLKVTGATPMDIEADKIIIATGSEPKKLPMFECDGQKIHDSTSILNYPKIPEKIAIVGGGVIGAEFASLYHALGTKVTIYEVLPEIIPTEGPDCSKALTHCFMNRGIMVKTQVEIELIQKTKKGIKVCLKDGSCDEAEMALICVGRQLNTDRIGLTQAGVFVESNGTIPVNDRLETNVEGIYAIGDITSKCMLAHVASHQGIVAANAACGQITAINYHAIPSVVYAYPEVASVGYKPHQAEALERKIQVGRFPFAALGKALATGETEGFAQIVIDRQTGEILGAQVVGHEASALISEMALAIENELTIESIIETIHPHPTISEIWLEAAWMAIEKPIHLPPVAKNRDGSKR